MSMAFCESGNPDRGTQESKTSFGHVKFEMPLRYANGCFQKVGRVTVLELPRKILAGDNDVRVIKLLPQEPFGLSSFSRPQDSF